MGASLNGHRPLLRLSRFAAVGLVALAAHATWSVTGRAQAPAPVDFARDVQPLLTERCLTCHGPAAQGGYRLDRRSGALGGVVRPNIIPGSSETSRLVRRISNSQFGPQMPPTGPLSAEEISTLTRWIDQGAVWPDALANEIERPAEDPAAVALAGLIRQGDRPGITAALAASRGVANGRGRGGATPLMEAALYGDAVLVDQLLAAGANPATANDAGATALMWGVHDVAITRRLLDAGADPNAASAFGRTTLQIAAAPAGSAPVVALLLERGAKATGPALVSPAARGDAAVMRLLLNAGARDAGTAAAFALRAGCDDCLAAIAAVQPMPSMRTALMAALPPGSSGRAAVIKAAIDLGADVRHVDPKSRSMPMLAAVADELAPESMQLLLDRGADVRLTDPAGQSALDFARRLGPTATAAVLTRAGAPSQPVADPSPIAPVRDNSTGAAIQRSLPLLQRTTAGFYEKSGCVSCHHNALTALTVAAARAKGFAVDEAAAAANVLTLATDGREARDQSLQGIIASGGLFTTTGYVLTALAAERQEPEPATDAQVRLLMLGQRDNGSWPSAYRPPSEASEFTATAVSLRSVQLYAGQRTWRRSTSQVVAAAAEWLAGTAAITTEDHVFRLFGLTWAKASQPARQIAERSLLALQRPDGGWAQLPTLDSDAYATGSALVALHEAGVRVDSGAYRRGVAFLLRSQGADGSWRVRSRSHPTQIYFDTGFPHGGDQFISSAATNWATQALVHAHEPGRTSAR